MAERASAAPAPGAISDAVWSAQATTPDAIEAALRELLMRQHAQNSSFVPARVLNMIVFVDRAWSGEIRNPFPEAPPDINVAVDRLPAMPTSAAGVTRRMIFDYALSNGEHRYVQMGMLPESLPCVGWLE